MKNKLKYETNAKYSLDTQLIDYGKLDDLTQGVKYCKQDCFVRLLYRLFVESNVFIENAWPSFDSLAICTKYSLSLVARCCLTALCCCTHRLRATTSYYRFLPSLDC